jgi:hypothetical protein
MLTSFRRADDSYQFLLALTTYDIAPWTWLAAGCGHPREDFRTAQECQPKTLIFHHPEQNAASFGRKVMITIF